MKKILIIYPHWPPSNLVGALRPRFIANYLPDFGWQPIVLTVNSKFYEEPLDSDLVKTVSKKVIVEYVDAKPVKEIRIIGDIGLRAFTSLKQKAVYLIKKYDIDFVWISIPSFYTAIIGRYLHKKTGIKYGIDYQDPWIRSIKNNINIRSVLSLTLAYILEPYVVSKSSLITGVSSSYYTPVLKRYFIKSKVLDISMPVGFDPNDYKINIENIKEPWSEIKDCKPIVYAGAFLPNSVYFIKTLFAIIKRGVEKNRWNKSIHLFFIGTGKRVKTITYYAKKYNIETYVHEYVERIPYLQMIHLLKKSYGLLIIGSIEKHYSASKVFQSLLSGRPNFAILHKDSSALRILKECNANNYTVKYADDINKEQFYKQIEQVFYKFLNHNENWDPKLNVLDKYSAKESAKVLVNAIEKIV